jgi:hypothetical protein
MLIDTVLLLIRKYAVLLLIETEITLGFLVLLLIRI